jgi:hypothetical protein
MINKLAEGMNLLAITVWVGCLWAIGYLAVPVLFQTLPDKMLAGVLAGKMFSLVAYVGIFCAGYLLLQGVNQYGRAMIKQSVFRLVVGMLLLTLLGQFGIQPIMTELKAQSFPLDVMHSAYADRFKKLHGIASLLYLVQSLLGVLLVLKTNRC